MCPVSGAKGLHHEQSIPPRAHHPIILTEDFDTPQSMTDCTMNLDVNRQNGNSGRGLEELEYSGLAKVAPARTFCRNMSNFWGFTVNVSKAYLLAGLLAIFGVLYRVREDSRPTGCSRGALVASQSCSLELIKEKKNSREGHEDYDVFICYRGACVKVDFVDHLQEALNLTGFKVYVDSKDISEGEVARNCIAHAIRVAPVCVSVLSKAFAESKFCLEELSLMLSSAKVFLPCLYDIAPSDLLMPDTGALKHALQKFKQHHGVQKLALYQAALRRATDVPNWDCEMLNGCCLTIVKRIVSRVQDAVQRKPLGSLCRYEVGLDKREAEVLDMLRIGPAARVIAVLGPGGVGKSTICKALYEHVSHLFTAVSYVEDVKEKSKHPRGLVRMQQQIIHDLCKLNDVHIDNPRHGQALIKEHLRGSVKVLIILDDIDDCMQVENLMLPDALGYGSRGIVATRDKTVVAQLGIHDTYEVRELTELEAVELFFWHAFMQQKPPHSFDKIATEVAVACGRIPLEIIVAGAHLCGEINPSIWGEVLTKLRMILLISDEKVRTQKRLRISYEALPSNEQEIFLDVASVLLGETADTAKRAWNAFGWSMKTLGHLIDKCLVQVDATGKLRMHDLLRDLGRQTSRVELTRLWMPDAEIAVKTNFKSQGLSLLGSKAVFPAQAFALMKDLRILIVEGAAGERFSYFPKNLTMIRWPRMPFYYVPDGIQELDKLAVLNLGSSKIEYLFDESADKEISFSIGRLRSLQELNCRGCDRLERLPENIGALTRLETINLSLCSALRSIPSSIGALTGLSKLDLSNCLQLQCLPESIGQLTHLRELMMDNCDRLKSLPETIGHMVRLRKLHLSGCSAVVYIPSSLGKLSNLQELSLSTKALSNLPNCLESLTGLRHFELFDISSNTNIDFVYCFKYLHELYLSKIEKPSECITELCELKKLFLSLSNDVIKLPDYLVQLSRLRELYLHDCSGLESLPCCINKLSNLRILDLKNCSKLTGLPNNICLMTHLQKLRLKGCRELKCLPEAITDLSEQCRATLSIALRMNSARERKLGNFVRMLAELNLASRVQPCNATIFTERSLAKGLLNDFDGALGDLDTAHHLSPSFSATLMARGRLKYLMGDFHSALADLEAAHILNPNDKGNILSMRRVVKVRLGNCQEVLNELNRCMELYPEDGFYMLERGVLKTYMNQLKGAMLDLNCALKSLGETYEVVKHRAYVEHLLGDDKVARSLACRAKQLRPLGCHEGVTCLAEMPVKFMEYDF
ncbi:uncharacterized protein [Physcomitrium patens]|uniref:uncharacterized protein isoform X1 n=1 Tax=Physcomitrium patens TaxID=3218 RepID=UPI000D1684A5|nr:disease resistance protein TAO1-like [Physcomitrium patens]XP_024366064.1 disease resistance protein TAO1-like [Physcomitrium patens]|eukprot:XP_024366063.1 disease resistance protein TAO1-like [Physcomitrella patens]